MTDKEKISRAENYFLSNDFHAHTVLDTETFKIIDWYGDKTMNLSMRFYIDLDKGQLCIGGDAYDASYCWYNKLTLENLASYMRNIGYSLFKQRSGMKYSYDYDDIIEDLNDLKETILEENSISNENEIEEIENALSLDDPDGFIIPYNDHPPIPSGNAEDIISKYLDIGDGCLYNLGERIHMRVYQWHIGFYMAVKELLASDSK